jgi:hypothetical protein
MRIALEKKRASHFKLQYEQEAADLICHHDVPGRLAGGEATLRNQRPLTIFVPTRRAQTVVGQTIKATTLRPYACGVKVRAIAASNVRLVG